MNITIDPEFKSLIPPLSAEELATLEANLVANGGARDPLVIWQGTLVDGHNRHAICTRLGLPYTTVELSTQYAVDRDGALVWMINNQLGRRNLENYHKITLQTAKKSVLGRLAKVNQGTRTDLIPTLGEGSKAKIVPVKVDKEIAKLSDTSHGTVHKVGVINSPACPKPIRDAVAKGSLSVNGGYEAVKAISRLPETKRAEAVVRIAKSSEEAADVKKVVGELKLEAKRALAEEIRSNPVITPEGKYQVIVIDPPWKYDSRAEDTTHRGKNLYPEMTVPEVCAFPLASMAQDNCILWLWTTNAFMRGAYDCLDAWGFTEKTILTWDKEHMGLGDWLRNQTEHCILAVKGKPVVSLTNQVTILREKRREHSRKPESFYALVDKLCPGSKLEIFSRTDRPGWTVWGAEAGKFK